MAQVSLPVEASAKWIDTGLDAVPGDPVAFNASGTWTDWFIICGPDGYDRLYMWPLGWTRRLPSAPWFCLCAALDQDISTAVPVGASSIHSWARSGRIFVFANDAPFAYGNNHGHIDLTVSA